MVFIKISGLYNLTGKACLRFNEPYFIGFKNNLDKSLCQTAIY